MVKTKSSNPRGGARQSNKDEVKNEGSPITITPVPRSKRSAHATAVSSSVPISEHVTDAFSISVSAPVVTPVVTPVLDPVMAPVVTPDMTPMAKAPVLAPDVTPMAKAPVFTAAVKETPFIERKVFESRLANCYSRPRAEIKAWLEWRLLRDTKDVKVPDFCASASRVSNVLLIIGKSGCGKRSLVRDIIDEMNVQARRGTSLPGEEVLDSCIELVDDHAVDSIQGLLNVTEEAVCLNRLQCLTGVQQLPVWLFPGFDGYSMTEKIDRPACQQDKATKFVPASAAVSRLLGIWGVLQQWDSKRHANIPPVILTAHSILEVEKMGLTSQNIPKVFMGTFRNEESLKFAKDAIWNWLPEKSKDGLATAVLKRFDGDFRKTVEELQLVRDNNVRERTHSWTEDSCTVKMVPPSAFFLGTVARGLHQHLSAFVFQEAKRIQVVWVPEEERGNADTEMLVYIKNFSSASVLKACGFVREELARLRVATMTAVFDDYLRTLLSAYMDSNLDALEAYCVAAVCAVMRGSAGTSPYCREDAELRGVLAIIKKHFGVLKDICSTTNTDAAMDFCRRTVSLELSKVLRRYIFEETLSVYIALHASDPRNPALNAKLGDGPCAFLSFSGMHAEEVAAARLLVERHRGFPASDLRVRAEVAELLMRNGAEFSLCPGVQDYRLVVDTRSLQAADACVTERVAVKLLRGAMERRPADERARDLFFNSTSDAVHEILHLTATKQNEKEEVTGYAPPAGISDSLLVPGRYLPKSKMFVFDDDGVVQQSHRDAFGKLHVVTPMALTKKRKAHLHVIKTKKENEQQVRMDAMNAFTGVDAMLWLYSYSGWHSHAPVKGKDFPGSVINIAEAWSFFASCDFKKALTAKDLLQWFIVHRLRFERVSENTLDVVWPKASPLVADAKQHPPKKRQTVAPVFSVAVEMEPPWGKQRPDMTRGMGVAAEDRVVTRAQIYQKLRQLRLGCIETASNTNLVVADAVELMRLKTQRESIRTAVLHEAKRKADATETDDTTSSSVDIETCRFCRISRQSATPEEAAAAELCGGCCSFKAPRLTDVKAAKESTEAAFGVYAVRGFRSDLLPPVLQDDKSNPEANVRRVMAEQARRQLTHVLQEYSQRVLSSTPGISLSVFKDQYWCGAAVRCTPTCWCSLPETFTLLRSNPGLKPVLEAVVLVELEDLFFQWRAFHGEPEPTKSDDELAPITRRHSVLQCFELHSEISTPSSSREFKKLEEGVTEVPGSFKQWTRHGKLHRADDLPARIEYTRRGTSLFYYYDGIPHRSVRNLPHVWHQLKDIPCSCKIDSSLCTCDSQIAGDQYVWLDAEGKPHRDQDLPAVVGPGRFKQWYCHGVLHRQAVRGPAQMTEDGTLYFYENGVQCLL